MEHAAFRPLFSASHSALFERRREGTENPVLVEWNHQMGVPGVFNEIWGPYVDRSRDGTDASAGETDDEDTVVSVHDGDERVEHSEREVLARRGGKSPNSHVHDIGGNDHATLTDHLSALTPLPPPTMAPIPHTWISLWFLITIPVIFWDAGYCFMRPRSMSGGDLHWIWKPYALYQNIDYVYGLRAFENGEGFTNAQSFLNIVENLLNIGYLYLAHIQASPVAPLVGLVSVVMTLSKTVLYWLQEYYCGGCSVGHNDFYTLFVYWVIPNGLWLLVPGVIVYVLGKDIARALRTLDKLNTKKASSKKQR